MSPAPIILFAYCRPDHVRGAVESLQKNSEAKDSVLYVFSDGIRSARERSGVDAVRAFLKSVNGFARVEICERAENWGLAKSIIVGVSEVLKKHERAIIVEDDLVVSPHFLAFMNEGLETYAADERVASLCGYFYPVKGALPETFFLREADCWGWATWRRGWDLFKSDGVALLKQIEERKLEWAFDAQGSYPYTQMLRDQIAGRNHSWAIRWQASLFLAEKLTLYPRRSLVQNTGFDGTGEHCGLTKVFEVEHLQGPVKVGRIPIEENKAAETLMAEYFRRISAPPRPTIRSLAGRVFRKLVGT
ncbi:MAG: glycosyltransferase family 2 protein [Deltaproteobacteria bacterium]|nr:glycosyltransferase family 2 protein [Deltaproteobacteria bacterium]MBI3293166.1 glycosyltransferase family 2 protein [Deltaproteobacteria bacterium]